jgi:acyl-CoA dehydrogenase
VQALTDAGWLAALIPQDYGGSGLGLTEASVIMEEINRSGGNSGACHGQMYNMGTLLRHGSDEQKAQLPSGYRQRRIAAAIDGCDRADDG